MSPDTVLALFVFCLVGSITPGPNNVMLLASGANFGFRRTLPHMIGIEFGFVSLLTAVGFGLGALLTAFPALHLGLKIAGSLYLVFLAWKIATSSKMAEASAEARPLAFHKAALFQWVNPKAWVLAVSAMAIYTRPDMILVSTVLVIVAFALAGIISAPTWIGFGSVLRGLLGEPRRLRWFNLAMGALLVLTLVPMMR